MEASNTKEALLAKGREELVTIATALAERNKVDLPFDVNDGLDTTPEVLADYIVANAESVPTNEPTPEPTSEPENQNPPKPEPTKQPEKPVQEDKKDIPVKEKTYKAYKKSTGLELSEMPKETIFIPLSSGEKNGAAMIFTINGYSYTVKKNERVEVPKEIADMYYEHEKKQLGTGEIAEDVENSLDKDADKKSALS